MHIKCPNCRSKLNNLKCGTCKIELCGCCVKEILDNKSSNCHRCHRQYCGKCITIKEGDNKLCDKCIYKEREYETMKNVSRHLISKKYNISLESAEEIIMDFSLSPIHIEYILGKK